MNIGKFRLDQESIVLLITMMVFTIGGYRINQHYNKPVKVVIRSVEKGLDRGFRASIEGRATRRGSYGRQFRARQAFSPDTGIRLESDDINTSNADQLPYDALTVLQTIIGVPSWTELNKEDMYGKGARHFTGSSSESTEEGVRSRVYEYWIDMKTKLPVRITLSEVIRDPDFEEEEYPSSLQIYLNIRYFGWQD